MAKDVFLPAGEAQRSADMQKMVAALRGLVQQLDIDADASVQMGSRSTHRESSTARCKPPCLAEEPRKICSKRVLHEDCMG